MARCVLVSGSSRGIGRALVEHLLSAGDRVIGCARSESTLIHERYTHIAADVTDGDAVQGLLDRIASEFGSLDALINNAGAARMLPVALTPLHTAREILDGIYEDLLAFNNPSDDISVVVIKLG